MLEANDFGFNAAIEPEKLNGASRSCRLVEARPFRPLPLGTLCVALRIFPSGGKGSAVKRRKREWH